MTNPSFRPAPAPTQPGANPRANPFRTISIGGGVQSSTLALMGDRGEFGPPPDHGIFADTGWEPPETLQMINWLATEVSYPIHIVRAGNLKEDLKTKNYTSIPMHSIDINTGHKGMGRRQCTNEYKIRPITQKLRELLGVGYKQRVPSNIKVETWLGISWDEVQRMKDSQLKWQVMRYPLIEAKMTREDCKQWWSKNAPAGAPKLTRSACVGCPYKSRDEWQAIELSHPELVDEAAELEETIKQHKDTSTTKFYLHRSRIPLKAAMYMDFYDWGEQWDAECDGVCGV